MAHARPTIAVVDSIEPLARASEAWVSDIWGVLHNGLAAFPEAGAACVRFRERGGSVVLVTNAPRPEAAVARMLDRLGVPRLAWDAIITSGDVSRGLLADGDWECVHHLGPPRDAGILEGLALEAVPGETADVVLCTGLIDDEREQPEDYRGRLAALAQRGVPLICANPDLVVERGERLVPCAGALAQIFEAEGGRVIYAGKPYPAVYARAYAAIAAARGAVPAKERLLAIGDGLRTHVEGAAREGLACVFIASALHVEDRHTFDAGHVEALFVGHHRPPVAAMRGLRW